MKTKRMLKELKLSEDEFLKIKTAVGETEQKTTGEIVIALTSESAHYAFWELLASVSAAAVVFAIMLPFAPFISEFSSRVLWQETTWILPAFYGVTIFFVIVAAFYVCNIPAIDRFVIPKKVQSASVSRRAFRAFAELGIHTTVEHSGILIFVSYLEHEVRIIADSGIAQKIPYDLWKLIADDLTSEIKNRRAIDGFLNAIEKCGELLSENFPAKNENPNELSDGIAVLGGDEWY